jgi:hypothetical protein
LREKRGSQASDVRVYVVSEVDLFGGSGSGAP